MNFSRLGLAALVAWLVSPVLALVVHGYVLGDLYAAHAALFRPRADMNLPLGFGAQLLGFLAFAYMYAKGYEGTSGLQEGLRFGVLIGLLLIGFGVVWSYVMMPISGELATGWAIDSVVEMAVYGTIVGSIYRPRPTGARARS